MNTETPGVSEDFLGSLLLPQHPGRIPFACRSFLIVFSPEALVPWQLRAKTPAPSLRRKGNSMRNTHLQTIETNLTHINYHHSTKTTFQEDIRRNEGMRDVLFITNLYSVVS